MKEILEYVKENLRVGNIVTDETIDNAPCEYEDFSEVADYLESNGITSTYDSKHDIYVWNYSNEE